MRWRRARISQRLAALRLIRVGRPVAAQHAGLDARPQLLADDGIGGRDALQGPADGLADGEAAIETGGCC
jgi:hypothetical protein